MIIIGSGISAMISAYSALTKGSKVIMLTKNYYQQNKYKWQPMGGCSWKTHAFNMPINTEDIVDYITDTLVGADYLANKELVNTLCTKASENIQFLESIGVQVDRDSNGNIIKKPFGGNGKARAVFVEDRLGFHLTKALNKLLTSYINNGQLQIITEVRVTALHSHHNLHDISFININTNEEYVVSSKTVIFADGAGVSMYSPSAASFDKTCDGLKIALDNNISLIDMEFIQFHPTGMVSCNPVFNGSLFEESLRFAGATLHNKLNQRFAFNYNTQGEQSTRDKLSRAIFSEIQMGNDINGGVELDISNCYSTISNDYPALKERIWQSGYNFIEDSRILVKPVAHFMMGGVKINSKCETNIKGVYFVGESAGGVHGANRLGGNGLSEAIVFGQIAGTEANNYDDKTIKQDVKSMNSIHKLKLESVINTDNNMLQDMQELKSNMYMNVGPIRSANSLNAMLEEILKKRSKRYSFSNLPFANGYQLYLDYCNILEISEIIVKSAILRKESRGSHYRTDYPNSSNQQVNYVCTKVNNELNFSAISN